jgi:hypothetical protein
MKQSSSKTECQGKEQIGEEEQQMGYGNRKIIATLV